jgi:NADH-quinone oxidoreductase subunit J
MDWIGQHWLDWTSLLLIAAGVWWLMPRAVARPKAVGVILTLAGLVLFATRVDDLRSPLGDTVLFWLLAGVAMLSAVLMITNRNPVYSALWFAIVTLSVCGLFLLQYAPFLAAATVVVYAGAIVVTFVFVIMLAQQSGATAYDQRSRQPLVATVAAFALLAILFGTMQFAMEPAKAEPVGDVAVNEAADSIGRDGMVITAVDSSAGGRDVEANPFSQIPKDQPLSRMHALGRSLFGDYLFAVELAGTLLLVATIGAIAIAPRRRRGTL